jgi:hypothetical protein
MKKACGYLGEVWRQGLKPNDGAACGMAKSMPRYKACIFSQFRKPAAVV